MTKQVVVCGELHTTPVFHTHKCPCVGNSRSANRREVSIHEVADKRLCQHCYHDLIRDEGDPNPSTLEHYGGTLSIDNFYPDCVKCGSPGYIHVRRARTDENHLRGSWNCLKCNTEFDAEPPSPWHNVERLRDDEQIAHIHINIREADAREVASAHKIPADRLSKLATKAKRRLAGWRIAADGGVEQ